MKGKHRVPILFDVFRPIRVCVPASSWENEDILVLKVANTLWPGLNYRAVAVCEQWVLERDARIKVLADEEVAVVQSCGIEADEDFLGARGGFGYFFELETVGRIEYLV